MATTTVTKGQPGSQAWFRDSFVLHKLHSLSGVLPIGLFMIFHLVANSYSLRGETEFNTVVKVIGYTPFVLFVEIAVIFLPIIFHAVYGLFITAEMQGPGGNIAHYAYGRNWLYWLQRVTGIIALLYILYHVWSTTGHRWGYEFGGGREGHEQGYRVVSYMAMAYRFAGFGYLLCYIVGIAAAAFHLGNGIFNFCIRWGIAIGKEAQKVVAAIGWLIGLGLALLGSATAVNFHVVGTHYPIAPGQTINLRDRYQSLEELVKSIPQAPAAPLPGAKPDTTPGPALLAPQTPAAPSAPIGGQP